MSGTRQGSLLASTIGRNIRAARDERGLKQRELARLVGEKTSGQQISDWERGAVRPSDTSLLKIAEAVGRDFVWFFVDHDADRVAA